MLWDSDYKGPRWTYGLTMRPLNSFHVPKDFIVQSARSHPNFRHGTVDYARQLTDKEVQDFDLTPVVSAEMSAEIERRVDREILEDRLGDCLGLGFEKYEDPYNRR